MTTVVARLSPEQAMRIAALRVKYRRQAAVKAALTPPTLGGMTQLEIYANPAGFFSDILGATIYPKQAEMLEAVRDNQAVAVLGANKTGKDFVSGRLVLWWLMAHTKAKVIIIGPTHRQVAQIVWIETRLGYQTAKVPLGGNMLETPHWKLADDRFALGFSTDKPMNVEGFHSEHLMVIITEAHNVEQQYHDAAKHLKPERLFLTGNPFSQAGEFYDAFHQNSALYKPVLISAFDSPNVQTGENVIPGLVTRTDVARDLADYGEDSPMYKASVLGQFPDSLEGGLIARSWVDAAVALQVNPEGRSSAVSILAVDVARSGGDKTVVMRRDIYPGGKSQARIVHRIQGQDTMQTAGWVKGYLDDHPEFRNAVTVDDVGVGAGVTDSLREKGKTVVAFQGGGKPLDPAHFANATAEVWGLMARALKDGMLAIENDRALIGQLVSRKSIIQSDRTMKLESKDELRAKGGKSPDEGDALSMTFVPQKNIAPIAAESKASRWKEGASHDYD